MPQPLSRRGFFATLFGVATGAASSRADEPTRCPHYCDGVYWRDRHGPTDCFVHQPGRCPFCAAARETVRSTVIAFEARSVTTYSYDALGRLSRLTTAGQRSL